MPASVRAHHPDRVVIGRAEPECFALGLGFPFQPAFQAFGRQQLLGFESCPEREAERTFAGHRRVFRLFEDLPRHRNRVLDVVQRGHGARAMPRAVHDGGVELDHAFFVREAAIADAHDVGVVFRDIDAFFDGVEEARARLKDFRGAVVRRLAVLPGGKKHRATGFRRARVEIPRG